ncbi:MAG TPA: carboxypeptidase-like regulatory domain-containing protein [Phycisphaerae bacterium]|nr:carboxypeptidase-like regulatory domain-containing protein [Phycisphaerae bacterium]
MKRLSWAGGVLVGLLWCASPAVLAQWSNAELFNGPSETGLDVKTGGIAPAIGGGFHGVYVSGNNAVRYRRYSLDGTLSAPLTLFNGQAFNAKIAQTLNGDIHVVFEDWSQGPNNIRWVKSSDGGLTFPTTQLLTGINCAKHPHIAPFGMGQSPELIMSYYRSGTECDESLWSRRWNGSTWSAEVPQNAYSLSEFDCFGMARSPLDGSIYRTFDPSKTAMLMQRYDGTWSAPSQIYSGSWAVRQHMAINESGQIMLLWDDTNRIKGMLYTPGIGAAPVVDLGRGGYSGACDVCAIPGTNDFYMVVARDIGGLFHVYGRRWTNGQWQAEESVQVGQADAFMVTPLVTADAAGNIFCMWEYWGSGRPQQWYAVRPASPSGPTGTIVGTVRDSYGQPLAGVAVVVQSHGAALTGANGTYSVKAPVGTCTVEASKLHYLAQSVSGVVVTENATIALDFVLPVEPPAPVALTVTPGNQRNDLTWTAPASGNYSGVVIRYSTTGYPTSPTDGQHLGQVAGDPESTGTLAHLNLTNGQAVYYAAFSYFQDASRFYNLTAATGDGTPAGPGDLDRDGDVDQTDFGLFQLCLSGNFIPQLDADCQRAKLDGDDDVDQDDLAIWQRCYSGPGAQSLATCAD